MLYRLIQCHPGRFISASINKFNEITKLDAIFENFLLINLNPLENNVLLLRKQSLGLTEEHLWN